MNVKVVKEHPMGKKELRKEFCETLISMAEQDNRVVVLDANDPTATRESILGARLLSALKPEVKNFLLR